MSRTRTIIATVLAAVAGVTLGLASPAVAMPNGPWCDQGATRYYTPAGYSWYRYDSGTINNNSSASMSKVYNHTFNASLSATVSAEVGVSAKYAVAEVNAKLGVSVNETMAITTSETFTINVGPYTSVTYKDGLVQRTYDVHIVYTYSNCSARDTYGQVSAPDGQTDISRA